MLLQALAQAILTVITKNLASGVADALSALGIALQANLEGESRLLLVLDPDDLSSEERQLVQRLAVRARLARWIGGDPEPMDLIHLHIALPLPTPTEPT